MAELQKLARAEVRLLRDLSGDLTRLSASYAARQVGVALEAASYGQGWLAAGTDRWAALLCGGLA